MIARNSSSTSGFMADSPSGSYIHYTVRAGRVRFFVSGRSGADLGLWVTVFDCGEPWSVSSRSETGAIERIRSAPRPAPGADAPRLAEILPSLSTR